MNVRLKIQSEAWYHVHCRVAGRKNEYPLENLLCANKLVQFIQHFCSAYCCEVGGFSVMGNHYHMVVRFDTYRLLSKDELLKRALILYPKSKKILEKWPEDRWERLQHRLFDLSELMRNLQSAFAKWYNFTYDRRGRFWADRFKSTLLENSRAALDCILYVDLNPIRAGLAKRPEEHKASSIYLRHVGSGKWLIPLKDIVSADNSISAMKEYRYLLYYRGSIQSKEGQAVIPESIVSNEIARGFVVSGLYLKRFRFISDGLVMGSETFIREYLAYLRDTGRYLRRKYPIRQGVGNYATLREQRGHNTS